MKPVITTDRFEVFRATCERCQKGCKARDVYLAFFRKEDVPRPVCTVTVWPAAPLWDSDGKLSDRKSRYVEWCEVAEAFRREGIATEVLLAIQDFAGSLDSMGVTDDGIAFLEAIGDTLDSMSGE